MSRVIFICGPSGSGKSTYAQRLESECMARLSFDVEMWRRGISTVPLPQDARDEIEAGLRARLLELVAEGTDVVLDFSFWSRRMRDDCRRLLEPAGVVPETFYLATDRETVPVPCPSQARKSRLRLRTRRRARPLTVIR